MVVAMIAVRMMQLSLHEVVDVVAVRDRLVAATWPMIVLIVMRSTPM